MKARTAEEAKNIFMGQKEGEKKMKNGDFVLIEYVGRVKDTKEIFDLTSAKTAKKERIFNPKQKYEPILVIIGTGMIIRGVEEQLLRMNVSEEKEFEVKPAYAFGLRNPKLIQIISRSKFLLEKINPIPGLWVNIDGRNCKIQSVSGGRVRVDFNHPLAGKELLYWVKIVKQINKVEEKLQAIIKYYNLPFDVKIKNNIATISAEKEINPMIKKLLENLVKKWISKIKSLKFEIKKPEVKNIRGRDRTIRGT